MKKKLTNLLLVSAIVILVALMTVTGLAFGQDDSAASSDPATSVATMKIENPTEEVKVPEVLKHFKEMTYVESNDKAVLTAELETCKDYEFRLINLMNNKDLVDERHLVEEELIDVRGLINEYQEQVNAIEAEEARIEAMWSEKSGEYPVATQVWRYMKEELGWNDYVCAGVMGNMMAEVGGQTLNLQPYLYGHSGANYYGLCQWSSRYYPSIQGADVDAQLDFLASTVKKELDTYGYLFRNGLNYEAFCNLTDAEDAAMAFAKAYERCGSGSYGVRQTNALKAYNYFVE
jgi:hypothetical protein